MKGTKILRRALCGMMMLAMVLCAATAYAVPAKPGQTRTLTLTDGTTVTARLVGDEHGHFWLGQDGRAYQVSTDGKTYRAVDVEAVKSRAQARRAQNNARRARRMAPRKVGEVGSITGQKKGLIILVNFSDVKFQTANNKALYQRIANEENFSYGDFKGSMYDYFKKQSLGQFELTFDVVGPVAVSKTQSYYGGNDSNGDDQNPATMVIEALKLVDSQVNYANYDWDGDGEVEQVYVVYAGQGEADGGSDDTIWPHEWELSSAAQYGDGSGAQTLDGVTINTYACGGELNGDSNIAGIGTMCHEFSHCLGYPDFYDTDYSGGQGMFAWDLMDSGSYNDDGYQPAGYTSYERWVAGWATPTELTTTQQVSNMPDLQASGQSYVIYNPGNQNEYFLLENRQKTGWDASLPGAGLLILHVDYSSSAWSSNTPNDDPSHQRMTWIAADNQYQYTTYQGTKYYTESGAKNDPFPYGNVNAFGPTTTPAAKFYNKNTNTNTYYLDSSVENITQNSDKTVSFKFVGVSNVATPTFSPKGGRYAEAQTVSITCATAGATIYYTLDGTAPTTSSTRYTGPITISETKTLKAMAVSDGEESATATAKYTIGQATSDPTTTTFRLVSSVDDLEPGLRYIIACGSKATAAGSLGSQILGSESVTVSGDVITIDNSVAVFVLEETADGWTFQNESTDQYLYATALKKLAYGSDENVWTLSNGTAGVIMTYGSYGTMLYNSSSPRFTTYTSNPTSSMIQANLYVEDGSATPTTPDPLIVADESLTFSATVGTSQTKAFEVLSEGLTEDITATLTDANHVFTLGATTISRTASKSGASVNVTFQSATAGIFTGTVTLTSAGAAPVTIALSATATESTTPGSDPDATAFRLVTSTDNLVSGKRYIIACGSENVAAGGLNNKLLTPVEVTVSDDVISLVDGVAVFVLTGSGTSYSLKNESTNQYLNSTTAKSMSYSTSEVSWTLSNGTNGVELTCGSNGSLTYNVSSPRITTYTSNATATMIRVNLYMETSEGVTPGKTTPTMTFSTSAATATMGGTFTEPTLTTNPTGLAVTYASSKTSVATVNASTGKVTLVGAGSTTITATFAGNDNYNAATASYTLTVSAQSVEPGDGNSADNPYTVAEVHAIYASGTLPTENVYVKGIVSNVKSLDTSKFTNAQYYISDDGSTTDQFYIYNGKYLNGADFTSNDQLQVGDTVVVCGKLTTYNGTNEMNSGNYLVSLIRPGTTPDDPDEPVVTGDDKYELVTDASTLADGDQILIAFVDDLSSTQDVIGATQAASNRPAVSVTLNADGTLTPGEDAQVITLEMDEEGNYLFNVGTGYLYAASSTKNQLKTQATPSDNAKATIDIADGEAVIVFQGTNTRNTMRYNPNNGSPIFSCYVEDTATGYAPQIYRKVADSGQGGDDETDSGDVNKDGSVSIADVTALVNIVLGKIEATDDRYDFTAADVNKDGSVTIADVTALVNVVLGKN
ncbi:MAG: M6 family metalloprotease domain-containing protein [Bacteroidaceae bacterium]|nr:M6 family metalloprotease domain-containing protein [Bacteroidaceae bacterium]